MKRVILCPNPYKDRGLAVTREAMKLLEGAGFEVKLSPELLDEQETPLPEDLSCSDLYDALEGAALVVSLGGDGTIMHTVRRLMGHDIPVIGVNLGTVGFLAELERSQLPMLVEAARGNFTPSPRMMLQVEVERAGEIVFTNYALNDVTMHGLIQSIRMTASGDGRKIFQFSGDGIVISSPTGSTAYSLSAGGPIVEPTAENIIVTPICAQALIARSFVLEANRVVTVQPQDLRCTAYISVDGGYFEVRSGDILRVRKAPYKTMIAHVGDKAFYDIVFEKLGEAI